MRFTTATLALLTCVSCVGAVGGDSAGRDRDKDEDPKQDVTDCSEVEEVVEPVTLRTAADFDTLPEGCWDLFSTLSLEGSQVSSLAKLGRLIGVDNLQITGTSLTSLDVEQPLLVYGNVTIKNNPQLQSLDKLELLRADNLTTEIIVDNNAALASLGGVTAATVVDGNLVIANNPKLETATLTNLEAVGGSARIANNAALTTVDLSRVSLVRGLDVSSNVALKTLNPPNTTEIAGNFTLRGNRVLATIGTMGSLARVTGNLTIDDNDALVNLSAFTTSMQYVTGALTVSNNAALTDIGQASRLLGIGSISILSNPNLSFCRAQEVDHCVGQHGPVSIQNNKDDNNCDCWCH